MPPLWIEGWIDITKAARSAALHISTEGQALVGRKGPTPFWGLTCSAPCQRPLGAATISEIYFGICSKTPAYIK